MLTKNFFQKKILLKFRRIRERCLACGSKKLQKYEVITSRTRPNLYLFFFECSYCHGHYGTLLGPFKYIKGEFYAHNDPSNTTNIVGLYVGSVILGRIGDIDVEDTEYDIESNETNYVGLGDQNETNFDWRLMCRKGPTFYVNGTFTEFD